MTNLLLLTACSVFNPVNPNVNTYTLESVSTKTFDVASAGEGGTLLVLIPTAVPGYQSRQMIYVEQPYQLQAYTRNEWIAPPTQMLQPLIEESLRNTGYFHTVVGQPFTGASDVRLEVELLKLQQEFMYEPSEVLLEIRAILVNSKTNQVVTSKILSAEVPTSANNPRAGVAAANQATRMILEQLAKFAVQGD